MQSVAAADAQAAYVRRPRLGYESHAVALDRSELGALLVTAGLRVPEATGADIEHLGPGVLHAARVASDAINAGGRLAARIRPIAPANVGGRTGPCASPLAGGDLRIRRRPPGEVHPGMQLVAATDAQAGGKPGSPG